jgi:hypothetical protein
MVKKIGSAYIATQNLVTFHQKITPAWYCQMGHVTEMKLSALEKT